MPMCGIMMCPSNINIIMLAFSVLMLFVFLVILATVMNIGISKCGEADSGILQARLYMFCRTHQAS